MERALLAPAAVKATIGAIASGTVLAQLIPVAAPVALTIESVTRLGLTGAALVAVVVLWRALEDQRKEAKVTLAAVYAIHAQEMATKDIRIAEKDAQVVAVVGEFTKVTTSVLDAVRELRGSVNDLRDKTRQA